MLTKFALLIGDSLEFPILAAASAIEEANGFVQICVFVTTAALTVASLLSIGVSVFYTLYLKSAVKRVSDTEAEVKGQLEAVKNAQNDLEDWAAKRLVVWDKFNQVRRQIDEKILILKGDVEEEYFPSVTYIRAFGSSSDIVFLSDLLANGPKDAELRVQIVEAIKVCGRRTERDVISELLES